ncbi:Polyketide cyclase / dehydrase and lipid transport [Nonomuraea solani]|uniref:Polyketide cyclase / dehydrase and lipid transport n=1 Tax=Nonomuraea solani TaxID=1144553 RepID=A0A1H6EY85_9ACTN|nr:SRPBCC family protein [Nonomuraea solani]SEH02837.1 Polyketide cyclase / dehydrase and lipid transport [Nonomuraea solani]
MSTIEHSEDVNVPVRVAYNQWTQFESFPEFMEGVESVKQIGDTRTQWVAEIAGVKREFDAEITEQHPDERVAWRSTDRPHHAGVVTFHRIDDDTTRVTLQMEYDPEGFLETAGDWLQLVRMRVISDLKHFKQFIEARGGETGGWRGDVPGKHQREHESGSLLGDADDRVPPGTVGGDVFPPGGTLPPPGPVPPRNEPPEGPRPVL